MISWCRLEREEGEMDIDTLMAPKEILVFQLNNNSLDE
jgi:hypothetical protein